MHEHQVKGLECSERGMMSLARSDLLRYAPKVRRQELIFDLTNRYNSAIPLERKMNIQMMTTLTWTSTTIRKETTDHQHQIRSTFPFPVHPSLYHSVSLFPNPGPVSVVTTITTPLIVMASNRRLYANSHGVKHRP